MAQPCYAENTAYPPWTKGNAPAIRSRYCGVKTTLKAGDKVTVNQEIGHLTDIPCEMLEDPHLHLEILVDGAYTDPVKALGRDVKYSNPTQAVE